MSKVAFGDVVKRANTKEDKDHTEKKYYVGGEHIDSSEILIEKRGVIAGSTIGPMFYFGFKAGQVLFVSRNPHLRKAGVAAFDGICSEKTFVLETADESVLLQDYLPFVLQSDSFWSYAETNKSGSVNFFVNWSTLARYEFELPPVSVQRKAADLLWAITRTRAAYRTVIQRTDDLVKSQFVEWFEDTNVNKKKFPVCKLSELCKISSSKRIYQKELTDNGIPFLKVSDLIAKIAGETIVPSLFISNSQFQDFREKQLVPISGDILVTSRGTIGKCYIMQEDDNFYFQDGMISWLHHFSDLVTPLYIANLFSTPSFQKQIRELQAGSTVAYLSIAKLNELDILLPPLDLQNRFAAFVEQSDKSKFELEQALARLTATYRRIIEENLG